MGAGTFSTTVCPLVCFNATQCISPDPTKLNKRQNIGPGHAGAMLQARQLGDELYVGVHSDESILENKGPTVMNLQER